MLKGFRIVVWLWLAMSISGQVSERTRVPSPVASSPTPSPAPAQRSGDNDKQLVRRLPDDPVIYGSLADTDPTILAVVEVEAGLSSLKGEGVEKDAARAVQAFRRAAERNYAPGQHNLGLCYYFGQGVAKNEEEAVKCFRKGAEQKYAPAEGMLGFCYYFGQGVSRNHAEAIKWLRKAAEQNFIAAQFKLGACYYLGDGVQKNYREAVKWYRKAAEQNHAAAQVALGERYQFGDGVRKDYTEAAKWYRKAAEQNSPLAQFKLGACYYLGRGVPKDYGEAIKWFRQAAEQNDRSAQGALGDCYYYGEGVPKNYVEAYKWLLLAGAQGDERSTKVIPRLETLMSREQVAEGQTLARDFKPRETRADSVDTAGTGALEVRPKAAGTGFFITEDGYLITNHHVAGDATQVRLMTPSGLIGAKVLKVDAANDLALLKAEGKFNALPVAASRGVKLGTAVASVGFPNISLQGFAPKLARGEIASLAGPRDDPRFFQISVPVQPGNSGGALVDEYGNVIGVVSAKLSAATTLKVTGELPENVNYAVKSSFLLGFLESVPDVSSRLKEPNASAVQFADVVESAKAAAILVLVY